MNKLEFEMINKNIKSYRNIFLLSTFYVITLILLFSINFLSMIYFFKNGNLITFIIFFINLVIIILILVFKGKEINKMLINGSLYFEYKKIINKEPIYISNTNEVLTKLKSTLKDNKYKIVKENNKIIEAKKNKLSIMLLSKFFVKIYFYEKLTLEDLKKLLVSTYQKKETSYGVTISYIIFLSNDLEEKAKEYLNYSFKNNERINKYVIPISVDLTTGNVYFKKVEVIFGLLIKNEINYMIYKLFKNEKPFKITYYFYKILTTILILLSIMPIIYVYYIYKNNIAFNFGTFGFILLLIFVISIYSSFDLFKRKTK